MPGLLKRNDYLVTIGTAFTAISTHAERVTAAGKTDFDKDCEDLFCDVLNIAHDLSLVNMNRIKVNHPAIDLGDDAARVSYQVTATSARDKIQKTLNKFFEHGLENKYDSVFVFVLTKKKRHRKAFEIPAGFSFNTDTNVLDVADVEKHIAGLSKDKIAKLANILKDVSIIGDQFTRDRATPEDEHPHARKIPCRWQDIHSGINRFIVASEIDSAKTRHPSQLSALKNSGVLSPDTIAQVEQLRRVQQSAQRTPLFADASTEAAFLEDAENFLNAVANPVPRPHRPYAKLIKQLKGDYPHGWRHRAYRVLCVCEDFFGGLNAMGFAHKRVYALTNDRSRNSGWEGISRMAGNINVTTGCDAEALAFWLGIGFHESLRSSGWSDEYCVDTAEAIRYFVEARLGTTPVVSKGKVLDVCQSSEQRFKNMLADGSLFTELNWP